MRHRFATDRWLFLSTIALCLVGAVMVFSASAVTAREQYHSAYFFLIRQAIWLVFGLVAMLLVMNVDYRQLRRPAIIFSALTIVLLLLVAVFFLDKSHATHRWVRIGAVGFQPSEIAKLAVILYLGWFLSERMAQGTEAMNDWRRTLLPALAPVLLIAGLVLLQPDLGTAIEIFLIALVMLFVSGISLKWVLGPAAAVLPVIICLVVFVPW
jgi:cell division protein FtsW